MKIAVVSHDSFWPMMGGGGIRVYWVVKMLLESGHDVTLIAPMQEEEVKLKFPGLKTISLGNITRFSKNKEIVYSKMGLKIFHALTSNKFDVIYAHDIVAAFPSLFVSKIKRTPLVYDVTDWIMGYSNNKLVKKYGPKLDCSVARHATKVITMCDNFKTELGLSKVKNIDVVHHGVDIDVFDPSKYKPGKENLAIYIGGIEKHDGVNLVPHAVYEIIKEYPDFKVLFIGKGAAVDELKYEIKILKLEDHFEFIPWVDHEDLPGFITKAKIGLIPQTKSLAGDPSKDFSQVLKGLEYMAMETPLVAPNQRGMYEEVGNNNERGIIFDSGDYHSLAKAMLELLDNDEECAAKGKRGREFILNDYVWRDSARKIIEICEKQIK